MTTSQCRKGVPLGGVHMMYDKAAQDLHACGKIGHRQVDHPRARNKTLLRDENAGKQKVGKRGRE